MGWFLSVLLIAILMWAMQIAINLSSAVLLQQRLASRSALLQLLILTVVSLSCAVGVEVQSRRNLVALNVAIKQENESVARFVPAPAPEPCASPSPPQAAKPNLKNALTAVRPPAEKPTEYVPLLTPRELAKQQDDEIKRQVIAEMRRLARI